MVNVSAPAALAEDGYDAARFGDKKSIWDARQSETEAEVSQAQGTPVRDLLSESSPDLSAGTDVLSTSTTTTSLAAPSASLSTAAGTTYTVTTSDELKAVLDQVQGGDTVLLEGGFYDRLSYDGRYRTWDGGEVTITAADSGNPPVFTDQLILRGVDGVTLDGIHIDAANAAQSTADAWLYLRESTNVTLRNMSITGEEVAVGDGMDPYDPATTRGDRIEGYAYGTGLSVLEVDGLVVENVEFQNLRISTLLRQTADADLSNLHVHDVREGVQFTDVQNLTIRDSLFEDLKIWLPFEDPSYDSSVHDHPDFIQYWGVRGVEEINGVTIKNNQFYVDEGGSSQIIFGHMNGADPGYVATDFTVTDNIIVNAHPNSIYLSGIDGALVENNVLLPNSVDILYGDQPLITFRGGSTNVHLGANAWATNDVLMLLGAPDAADLAARNITIDQQLVLSLDPTAPNYWGAATADEWMQILLSGNFPAYDTGGGGSTGGGTGGDTGDTGDTGGDTGGTGGDTGDTTTGGATETDVLGDPLSTQDQIISGLRSNDLIQGGAGNDQLFARYGDDTLTGNGGADQFLLDARYLAAGDVHRVTDLDFTEGDWLEIRFLEEGKVLVGGDQALQELGDRGDINLSTSGSDLLVEATVSGGTATIVLENHVQQTTSQGSVTLGTGADDVLVGTEGDDQLFARYGDDTLTGNGGADQFLLDARYLVDGDSHIVTDLDFAEGDWLEIRFLNEGKAVARDADELLALNARGDVSLAIAGADLVLTADLGSGAATVLLQDLAWTLPGLSVNGTGSEVFVPAVTLIGGAGDDLLVGSDEGDSLMARYGSDTLTGAQGGDQFLFDARYMSDGDSHIVTDLDFAEGDWLEIRFLEEGKVKAGTVADLAALEGRGDIDLSAQGGDLVLSLTYNGTDASIQFQGLASVLSVTDPILG